MQTKIHEPTQIVEVMLTHAEQADEAVQEAAPGAVCAVQGHQIHRSGVPVRQS